MSDFSALFYLLHAERRLVQQLFARRNQSLGLSRERVLQWTQGEEESLNRLLASGIIEEKRGTIQLKQSILIFLETEQGLPGPYRTATFLEELQDWDSLSLQFEATNKPAEKQKITTRLVQQLRAWEEQIPRLITQLKADEQTDRWQQLKQGLTQLHVLLMKRSVFRSTSTLELDEKVLDFTENIPEWIQKTGSTYVPALLTQVQKLQGLRIRDLLLTSTNLQSLLEKENALLFQAKPSFQTQIAPRQIMGSRKRKLPGFAFPSHHLKYLPNPEKESGPAKSAEPIKNLVALWDAFRESNRDLVSFLNQSQENWEPLLMEMITHFGNELRFTGKWVKVGGSGKYAELWTKL